MKPALGSLCLFNFDLIGHQVFSMPLFHMFFQSAVDAERHLTNVTAVDLLTKLAMCLHVACELGALSAGIVAQLALVGPFASVTAPVHRKIATVLEHLATEFAGVTPPAVLGTRSAWARASTQMRCAAPTGSAAAARQASIQQVTRRC